MLKISMILFQLDYNHINPKERWKNLKNIFEKYSYIPMNEFQIMELLNILQLKF